MATQTVSNPELRLATLAKLCSEIASSIESARSVLRDDAENARTAHLVADALDRVGWLAERATRLTGAKACPVNTLDGWLLNDLADDVAAAEASHA